MKILKNYEKPQMKFILLPKEDIIRTSVMTIDPATMLKTGVNGKDAVSYGEQNVSIFD